MSGPTQEERQLQCLNAIESLRGCGIGNLVDLPEMVVIGDQSAGKSSVIEAVTGISIPTSDGLCTRFPLVIALRSSSNASIVASIITAAEEPDHLSTQLRTFRRDITALDQVPAVVQEAGQLMGVYGGERRFCMHSLRLEISGPECLNLTITDLPGLFQTGGSGQSDEDADLVRAMVIAKIRRPRTLALVVVSAKVERVNQFSLKTIKEHDPQGQRSFGIITKLDYLSKTETPSAYEDYTALLYNKDIFFRHGWHAVKNRTAGQKTHSSRQRDQDEQAFFTGEDWKEVPGELKGRETLCRRLCDVQFKLVSDSIPSLILEAQKATSELQGQIDALGQQADVGQQRSQLSVVSHTFCRLLSTTLASRKHPTGDGVQALRVPIEAHLSRVVAQLRSERDALLKGSTEALQRIQYELESREITPGQVDAALISELFYEASDSWPTLIAQLHQDVVSVVQRCVSSVFSASLGQNVPQIRLGFEHVVLTPMVEKLGEELRARGNELISGHEKKGTIDFGPEIFEHIPKTRATEICLMVKARLEECRGPFDQERFLSDLTTSMQDINHLTAVEMISSIQQYHQKELDNLLSYLRSDVFLRVVHRHVDHMFTPELVVSSLDDASISHIFGGSDTNQAQKATLSDQLAVIESALLVLRAPTPGLLKRTKRSAAGPLETQSKRRRRHDALDLDSSS